MIDIKLILEKPEYVKASLAKKLWDFDPEPIIALSKQRIELLQRVEKNKAEQNALSASVPAAKKAGQDVKPIFEKVKALAAANKEDEAKLAEVENEITALVEVLPNLPDDDLLCGEKENNKPIYHFGEENKFNFTPRPCDSMRNERPHRLQEGRENFRDGHLDLHQSRRAPRMGPSQLFHRKPSCRWL